MPDLNSSQIASADWSGGRLTVRFRNGDVHEYSDVPKDEFDGLLKAPSAGKWFHARIRGRFQSRKVSPENG